jgi:asparagine synthetase A
VTTEVGGVPADWRDSRVLVRASINDPLPFVDVAATATLAAFRSDERVGPHLREWGVDQWDLSHVLGRDRRVTRLLSQ